MSKLKAYHGKIETKKFYVNRMKQHIKADELVRGNAWDGEKGCAVGCTLNKYNHKAYETELGIPEWLAKVEDTLFEGMSLKKSKTFPKLFLEAIKPGVDLEKAKAPFIVFILKSTLKSMDRVKFDKEKNPDVVEAIKGSKAAVQQMIDCWNKGTDRSAAWSAARSAARSAAWSAAESAESVHQKFFIFIV